MPRIPTLAGCTFRAPAELTRIPDRVGAGSPELTVGPAGGKGGPPRRRMVGRGPDPENKSLPFSGLAPGVRVGSVAWRHISPLGVQGSWLAGSRRAGCIGCNGRVWVRVCYVLCMLMFSRGSLKS